MPAGNTYEAIATQTLGSAAASVTFSSIPSTYTDLVLVIGSLTTTVASASIYATINSDTGTNYSYTILKGNGTNATSARVANASAGMFLFGYDAGTSTTSPTDIIWHLQNYANTTTYKTGLSRSNSAAGEVNAIVNLWRSTAAVNQLNINAPSRTFAIGSTFSLYGIKSA